MTPEIFDRLVAGTKQSEVEGRKVISRYRGRETARPVRSVGPDGICEILCGAVWRRAYVEARGIGKVIVCG